MPAKNREIIQIKKNLLHAINSKIKIISYIFKFLDSSCKVK